MNVAIKETLACDLGSAVLTKPKTKIHFQLIITPFVIISGVIDLEPRLQRLPLWRCDARGALMDWADGSYSDAKVDWNSGPSATLSTLIIMHSKCEGVQYVGAYIQCVWVCVQLHISCVFTVWVWIHAALSCVFVPVGAPYIHSITTYLTKAWLITVAWPFSLLNCMPMKEYKVSMHFTIISCFFHIKIAINTNWIQYTCSLCHCEISSRAKCDSELLKNKTANSGIAISIADASAVSFYDDFMDADMQAIHCLKVKSCILYI